MKCPVHLAWRQAALAVVVVPVASPCQPLLALLVVVVVHHVRQVAADEVGV